MCLPHYNSGVLFFIVFNSLRSNAPLGVRTLRRIFDFGRSNSLAYSSKNARPEISIFALAFERSYGRSDAKKKTGQKPKILSLWIYSNLGCVFLALNSLTL